MKGYIIFGGFRNLLGIAILTYLTHIGMSVTMALVSTLFIAFILYVAQVRVFVGKVNFFLIAKMFVFIFIANRILLWIVCEKIGIAIYFAQLFSIAIITSGSYVLLKIKAAKTFEKLR